VKKRTKITLLAMAVASLVVMLGVAATAADQVLQITAPANAYAHLYRSFPTQEGSEVWVQVSIKVGPNSGSSWTPSVFLYWDHETFAGLGQEGSGQFRVNAQKFAMIGWANVGIPAENWVDVRIGLTDFDLSIAAREAGGDWVVLQTLMRPLFPDTLPKEILLGKGFGNNTPTYPILI